MLFDAKGERVGDRKRIKAMDRSTLQTGHRMGLTENTATTLLALNGLHVHPNSAVYVEDTEVGLIWSDQNVAVLAPSGSRVLSGFEGESSAAGGRTLVLGPMNAANLGALRGLLQWLRPRPLGTRTSAGFGDRLGRATPGHVRALRAAGGGLAPIFAQQSIREMERTGRSPQEVLDDATWGVFAEGWQEGFGADADHLKTAEDIDACVAAGENAQRIYDDLEERLASPEYAPRALLERFNVEILCTTDAATDMLEHHAALRAEAGTGGCDPPSGPTP